MIWNDLEQAHNGSSHGMESTVWPADTIYLHPAKEGHRFPASHQPVQTLTSQAPRPPQAAHSKGEGGGASRPQRKGVSTQVVVQREMGRGVGSRRAPVFLGGDLGWGARGQLPPPPRPRSCLGPDT